ncbi:tetratricopeptide repeat protein [Pseudoduganella sp. FT25W]|uniref:Tetratricopeptide repeat protein n=1 Tax=Duganella alba TaxID=2666081 RepID=A0A6L5QDG6_9BURK|nr:tetratricopeptide repeat protein [Duganella alba]MRX07796.1 tetratricopeptide repeat protein [Duganella alba]MRX15399.1 tetratricopeptide repeat protein [Duganella alba]
MHTDPQQAYLDANHLLAAGDYAGAEDRYQQALALQPWHVAARANLGYLKEQQGAVAEAEFHYRQAIALMPDHPQLHQNLGALLFKEKRLAESEATMRTAVELAPDSPTAWSQLGALLVCTHREPEGEACYRQALALDPGHARAQFNLSYLLLRQARFEEGWRMLDARWQFDRFPLSFDCSFWQGEPLEGKSIALGLEAGHGDMIHFCRYAPMLKARGARRVDVVCHPALRRLFAALPGVDHVYALGEALPGGWDYWTRPMRLPGLFGTEMATIPADVPYLRADAALVQQWRCELPQQGLRVGLAWRGNANFENDADRSLPSLMSLAPLAAVDAHFVSLQKGAGEAEALTPPAGMFVHPIAARLGDFADTAAVIANLDLVISVDTAVAHLAGALGKPCWLLLPDYRCDWRWMADRGDTPWYPSMRLFRQPRDGGWAPVVAEVVAALAALAVRP